VLAVDRVKGEGGLYLRTGQPVLSVELSNELVGEGVGMKEQTLSSPERYPALGVDSKPLGVLDLRDTLEVLLRAGSHCAE